MVQGVLELLHLICEVRLQHLAGQVELLRLVVAVLAVVVQVLHTVLEVREVGLLADHKLAVVVGLAGLVVLRHPQEEAAVAAVYLQEVRQLVIAAVVVVVVQVLAVLGGVVQGGRAVLASLLTVGLPEMRQQTQEMAAVALQKTFLVS